MTERFCGTAAKKRRPGTCNVSVNSCVCVNKSAHSFQHQGALLVRKGGWTTASSALNIMLARRPVRCSPTTVLRRLASSTAPRSLLEQSLCGTTSILTIRFNQPKKLNAWTLPLMQAAGEAVSMPSCWHGDRHVDAGADLAQGARLRAAGAARVLARGLSAAPHGRSLMTARCRIDESKSACVHVCNMSVAHSK